MLALKLVVVFGRLPLPAGLSIYILSFNASEESFGDKSGFGDQRGNFGDSP